MSKVNQPENLMTRLRDLERRLAEVERGRTLHGATISDGVLEVRAEGGQVILRAGVYDYGGGPVPGVAIFRIDGSTQYWAFDRPGGGGYLTIYDEQQSELISNDTVSGQGLARPYIPDMATPYSAVLTPTQSTTSGTFTTLWRAHRIKQHPRVRISIIAKCGGDTSGEVRLAVGGSQISDTLVLPVGNFQYHSIWAPVPGNHLQDVYVDVDARRTAGTGSVAVEVVAVLGWQS